jgi:hypothetical protein
VLQSICLREETFCVPVESKSASALAYKGWTHEFSPCTPPSTCALAVRNSNLTRALTNTLPELPDALHADILQRML